jgi:hypothetical protein
VTTEANIMMTAKPGITASKPSLCTPIPLADVVEDVDNRDVAVIDEDEAGGPRVLIDGILLSVELDHVIWNFDVAMIRG